MNNKLIKKEDLSIFDKIRAFFTNIFHKKSSVKEATVIYENYNKQQYTGFEKNIKVDTSKLDTKERDLKEFIRKIENNTGIIENLSNDRLDKLIDYYEDLTNSKRIKIEKLKFSLS